ncbi:MAG: S-layer homology domain-containing protein [Oscillospiraceae bacterium]|nr:S-layer homology domain-containing protein [Oscillospiraceae bacterium]
MLFRIEGEPGIAFVQTFSDVQHGKWYSQAVNWAAENRIAYGIGNNLFAPDAELSRAQAVTLLFRFAQFKYKNVSAPDVAGTEFLDFNDTSSWAVESMHWAVHYGLIRGFEGRLNPNDTITRAEAAVLLARFIQYV